MDINKLSIFIILLCLEISCIHAQTLKVTEKEANNALMQYFQKANITNDEDQVFQNSQVLIGDVNKDGKEDAIVRYVLGLNFGNAVTGSGIVVFINNGSSLAFLTDYQGKPQAILKSISNGIIHTEEATYATGDSKCCPSNKINSSLVLIGSQLKEIK